MPNLRRAGNKPKKKISKAQAVINAANQRQKDFKKLFPWSR